VVKNKSKCGIAWSVLLSRAMRVIMVVKILWTHEAQPSESTTNLTTVMTRVVVDGSADHAKALRFVDCEVQRCD